MYINARVSNLTFFLQLFYLIIITLYFFHVGSQWFNIIPTRSWCIYVIKCMLSLPRTIAELSRFVLLCCLCLLVYLNQKTIKLFVLPVFSLRAYLMKVILVTYLMKVIPETRRVYQIRNLRFYYFQYWTKVEY